MSFTLFIWLFFDFHLFVSCMAFLCILMEVQDIEEKINASGDGEMKVAFTDSIIGKSPIQCDNVISITIWRYNKRTVVPFTQRGFLFGIHDFGVWYYVMYVFLHSNQSWCSRGFRVRCVCYWICLTPWGCFNEKLRETCEKCILVFESKYKIDFVWFFQFICVHFFS